MIPNLVDIGGPWKVLPVGIHSAALSEIRVRFATNSHRTKLFTGFADGVAALRRAGCTSIYLDGSYVTDKAIPGDFDACWSPEGVSVSALDPVFLELSHPRTAQKTRFHGEFFPSSFIADGVNPFIDFFQVDRHRGEPKGIIHVRFGRSLEQIQ